MKLLTPELLILAQMCTKSFVGADPLRELTALPQTPANFGPKRHQT